MVQYKSRYIKVIALIVFIALAVSSTVLLLGLIEKQPKKDPQIVQGELDLTQWDLQREGEIKLAGEWGVYWKRLLVIDDFKRLDSQQPRRYVDVPSVWNK
ncbi:MAG: response regulator [Paenibacillus sp.]|jgi:hypothetical protein|nr:response regulator [Paenibacillus sp.]